MTTSRRLAPLPLLLIGLAVLAISFIAHGATSAQESEKDDTTEQTVFSADMLVVEYTENSIGAATADLFSNIGGNGKIQIKSLWSHLPDRDIRLALTDGFADLSDHTLKVGDLELAFPEANSGDANFKWTNIDVDWEDGQTIQVSIVQKSALEQPASNTAPTGAPTITGNAQVDVTLTASTSDIKDDDGLTAVSYSYQWIRSHNDHDTDIPGATASTYILAFQDQGKTIKVQVSFTDDAENHETLTSAPTVPVIAALNRAATGAPAIDGTPKVRETLTATTSEIADEDKLTRVAYRYQWLADDVAIQGASNPTYNPADNDAGKAIKVKVSFTDDRNNQESGTSVATSPVAATTPTQPQTLTVSAGDDDQQLNASWQAPSSDGGSTITEYTVHWKESADSWGTPAEVSAATVTGTMHTITDLTAGVQYTVRVSATNLIGNSPASTEASGTPTSGTPQPITEETDDPEPVGLPIINGVPVVAQTLSVTTSAIEDENGLTNAAYAYQWVRSGANADTDIVGQTASTYTLVAVDVGNAIKVKVTFDDDANNQETRTSEATAAVVDKPNVIVILVDDLGYNDVSYNGATQIETTNIDRLASRGVTFTNGYVTYPTCTPSRAGLLTGRYPSRFGLEGNLAYAPFDANHGLPIEETLFPERLQGEGYRTGIVGKWQLGAARKFNPLNRGFDYFFGFLGGGHSYWGSNTVSPHNHMVTPLIENRGVGEFDGYLTDVLTDRAIEFIEQPADGPFFLYLAYNAPHTPLQAPDELIDKYSAIDDERRRIYLAMVDSLDQNIGRVLDTLDDSSLDDNTVIFFLSDNGGRSDKPPGGNHADNSPFRGAKDSFHEGGIHVPFVASWPAMWPEEHTYDPMVISLDISSTVLKLANATSVDPDRPLDGVDLDPFLRGAQEGSPHQALFWRDWRSGGYVVRSGDDKLIKNRRVLQVPIPVQDTGESPQLFDLKTDISESQDLLDQQPQTAAELAALWNAWNADNDIGNLFYGITSYNYDLRTFLQGYYDQKAVAAQDLPRYEIDLTLAQPSADNSIPTGRPTISGTPRVDQTLTADTSPIADEDGLENVSFSYQWIRSDNGADTDISGETDSTYTLVLADLGKTIEVQVTFTDDDDNAETLTSVATEPVSAAANNPATGVPTISGTVQVGEALTADTSGITDANGLTNVTFSYQWLADDADIQDATGSTYTLTDDDVGKAISVRATFTDNAGNEESLTSGATAEVEARPNSPATGAPTISGTAQAGETLTADTSGITDADGLTNVSYSYQWLAEDADIGGETASTYAVSDDAVGKAISVRVTFTDNAGNEESLTSGATAVVTARPNSPATGAPTISGTAQVGETLTANISGIADSNGLDNAEFSYQWLANNADIQNATDSTYTLTDDDVGKAISVRATFTDNAGNEESLTSEATAEVEARPNSPATGAPTISGTVQAGQTLTADTSGITDANGLTNVAFSYQWLADDADIQDATGSTYTLTDDDVGKVIKVKVTFTDNAGNEESLTSEATAEVTARPNSPATGAPTISGTAQVGETLTADTSPIADADGLTNVTFSYQWLAEDADIAGETASTYTLSDDDVGKAISVRATFTDNAGNEESLTSGATAVVTARPNSPATGAPTISGTAQVGETLTADTSPIADEDGLENVSYSYQWIRSDNGADTDISGETDSTYTLVLADLGKTIEVQVTFTDDDDNAETLTSVATEPVSAAANNPATGVPTISGTVQVGEALTADTSGITDDDGLTNVSYSYQWLADDAEIQGATDSTYTLTDDEVGKAIKVRVTFTDDASNEETLTSAATAAVSARPNNPATGQPTISGTAQAGETLTANTSMISDADGLDNAEYSYQWLPTTPRYPVRPAPPTP